MMKFFRKKDQSKSVEDNFSKYNFKNIKDNDSNITERDYCYCIIKLVVDVELENKKIVEDLLQTIIKAANETNGDVTNFCADSLVVLYGLPLSDPNLYENIENFIKRIDAIKSKIITIFGRETGLYGRFGYEKRYIVTAVGRNLVQDFNMMSKFKPNRIYIHNNVADKILDLKRLGNVEII